MWEIVKNIAMWVGGLYFLWQVGPPAVETYFLPTIEYVAGTFHAVMPQLDPVTTFTEMYTPMPAGHASPVLKTVFVRQAGYETMSMPAAATMTGITNGQRSFFVYQNYSESSSEDTHSDGSFQGNGRSYGFSPNFGWFARTIIYETGHAFFLNLRQMFDHLHFQVLVFAAPIVSWKLLKHRNKVNIKNLTALHELELVRIQQEISALTMVKDLEILSLTAANKSQQELIDTQRILLDEAKEEARLARGAKTLAGEKIKEMEKEKNCCTMSRKWSL